MSIASARSLAVLVALASSGCGGARAFRSPDLERVSRAWTLVVVRASPAVRPELEGLLEVALHDELAATGRFVPLGLPPEEEAALAERSRAWQSGPRPEVLVGLSREFGADALALVTVHGFDPYPPLRLALSIEVHSAVDGTLLYAHTCEDSAAEPGRPAQLEPREVYARRVCRELLEG